MAALRRTGINFYLCVVLSLYIECHKYYGDTTERDPRGCGIPHYAGAESQIDVRKRRLFKHFSGVILRRDRIYFLGSFPHVMLY